MVLERSIATMRPGTPIRNIAIAASDFSAQGALPTEKISDALSDGAWPAAERVIIAGGQVLDARWTAILGYLLDPKLDLLMRAGRRFFGEGLTDAIARKVVGIDWPQPFVIPAALSGGGVKVAYNAVGGADVADLKPDYLKALSASLRAADHVSVRDVASIKALKTLGIGATLTPDSAVVMSRLFDLGFLKQNMRDDTRRQTAEGAPYFVFQIGVKFLKGQEAVIAQTIASLCASQGLKVFLLAIGTATAHEDHVALKRIQALLDKDCLAGVLYDGNVWEIMGAIACARLYVGTSLHGAITAISFGVPRLAFTDQVKKLREFLTTWDNQAFHRPLEFSGNPALVSEALSIGQDELKAISAKLIDAAWTDLRKVVGAPA